MSVAVLVFMALGLPASGGPANLARFTPAPLRFLHPALPLGAAADAVRSAVYFDGYGTAGPDLGAGGLGPGRRRGPGPDGHAAASGGRATPLVAGPAP